MKSIKYQSILNRTIMKLLKTGLLVVAFAFSSVLFASTNSEDKGVKSVQATEEIGKLLKNPGFLVEEDITANVIFTVNKKNEMVVLSVDSKNAAVESFIKQRLNYEDLPVALRNGEKTFKLPVRVTSE